MSERKNVQTEHKWVARIPHRSETPYYFTDRHLKHIWGNEDPEHATLYDSPSDVPDDCTPVRVRVETWEEEGEPELWDGKGSADAFRMMRLYDGGMLGEPPDQYPTPLPARQAKDALRKWHHDYPASYFTALTAIPVRIPTETKRKVTLDPEPTETGCRCRNKVERAVSGFDPVFGDPMIPVDYEEGIRDMKRVVYQALADCDCRAPETVQ